MAHLWNILWALTTAYQSQAPTLAACNAASSPPITPVDAVVGYRVQGTGYSAASSPPITPVDAVVGESSQVKSSQVKSSQVTPVDAVVGDGFDYAAYATLRWERYLWEKERAGGDRGNGGM